MSEVARVQTPLDEACLSDVLKVGHHRAFGEDPTPLRLSVAWAQCALEHARGSAIWNGNIGNITAAPSWTGDYYVLHVEEQVSPGVWRPFDSHFRAWSCPEEGAEDYWKLLSSKFASVLPFFDKGDAAGAATQLHNLRYFTADVAPYARSMRLLAEDWFRKLA